MHVKTDDEWGREKDSLLEEMRRFAAIYRRRPFDSRDGVRGVSAFALYWFLRKLRPTIVLEVGVWRGFSTWVIEQAAPEAALVCFDPVFYLEPFLNRRRFGKTHRPKDAVYSIYDFSCADVAGLVAGHERPVAFLDDHQPALARLRQCRAAGILDVVFDDNEATFLDHRTLEIDRLDPESCAVLEQEIETYERFPAPWPVEARHGSYEIHEEGLGLPVERELDELYAERGWHSYVTYVRLRPEAA